MFFKKKKDKFHDCFVQAAGNLQRASSVFSQELAAAGHVKHFAGHLDNFKKAGCRHTSKITDMLNNTLITPVAGEDILAAAIILEEVLNLMAACAWRVELYKISRADEYIIQLANNIELSAGELERAVNCLSNQKITGMSVPIGKIKALAGATHGLVENGYKTLFDTRTDPLTVIKGKDILDHLGCIMGKCKEAADVLERIKIRYY